MSNPVSIQIPVNVWTLVAEGVTVGMIHKQINEPIKSKYLQTYKLAGEAAPTDDDEAGPLFKTESVARISHSVAIDVYIKAITTAGAVRVDL